jgi:uncharacterized protein (DUF2252 family)
VDPSSAARAEGRELRRVAPRSSLEEWSVDDRPRDPVAILEAQGEQRIPELLPYRYGRMAASPFGFFRGAAAVMAHDMSSLPVTGLRVQACGDAHVSNFGEFATPEGNVVFDINDFDETLPGPWEWDVERLCASLAVVGRQQGLTSSDRHLIVRAAARHYRRRIEYYAGLRTLDLWHERIRIEDVMAHFPKRFRPLVRRDVEKARRKDHLRAVARLTIESEGEHRFIEDPPLIVRLENTEFDLGEAMTTVDNYRLTLTEDRRELVDRYRVVDIARKAVGVGSVGTYCWVVLLEGPSHAADNWIVLQVKEAQASVLEPYVGSSALDHHGLRVVTGQRLTQAASDIFLGWSQGPLSGRHYYVRQLWNVKGQGDTMSMEVNNLAHYGALCSWALARAHARTGDALKIAGYLGSGDVFDRAMVRFADTYAAANEADHAALLGAIRSGRVEAVAEA